ncbi:MAG TPA: hypothetical protein VIK26_03170 [Clostridium sp.]
MKINYLKKQTFNSNELALFFQAFGKKLFIRPQKGDIFSRNNPNGSCTFYFNIEYYEELKVSMTNSSKQGKFTESNANRDWTNLMNTLFTAIPVESNDSIPTEDYYESVGIFWGSK